MLLNGSFFMNSLKQILASLHTFQFLLINYHDLDYFSSFAFFIGREEKVLFIFVNYKVSSVCLFREKF